MVVDLCADMCAKWQMEQGCWFVVKVDIVDMILLKLRRISDNVIRNKIIT